MRGQRGITLIELMVVLAVVGILVGIAVFMFTKQTAEAKAKEVHAVFAEIRLKQEAIYVENSAFLPVGDTDVEYFPYDTPEGYEQDFPAPGTTVRDQWDALKVRTDKGTLLCVYNTQVGSAGTGTGPSDSEVGDIDTIIGTNPAEDWYYIKAKCDLDGDGTYSTYYTTSNRDKIAVINKGE